MRDKVRFISFLLIIVLFFAVFTSCGTSKRQITIAMIQGEPEILKKGESEWIAITKGMVVNPGDYMRTGINEYIWMEINDGSYMGLGKETEAGLTTLSKSFNDPVTEIDLKNGMFFVTVTKDLGKGRFEVYTPLITAGVVGSKMAVDYDKTKSTADIACLEGTVTGKYGDDTASPQVDSGFILGVTIGTRTHEYNGTTYKIRTLDEVYNEFNFFDSRYRNPLWGTEEAIHTQERLWETNKVETAHMLDTIRAYTPTLYVTETPTPMVQTTKTPTLNRLANLRPTITVDPSQPRSSEEQANSGVNDYSLSAKYFGECYGPSSSLFPQMSITFEGNQVTLSSGNNESDFYKVDVNTYQGVDPDGVVVTFVFTPTGFIGGTEGCYEGTYTRD